MTVYNTVIHNNSSNGHNDLYESHSDFSSKSVLLLSPISSASWRFTSASNSVRFVVSFVRDCAPPRRLIFLPVSCHCSWILSLSRILSLGAGLLSLAGSLCCSGSSQSSCGWGVFVIGFVERLNILFRMYSAVSSGGRVALVRSIFPFELFPPLPSFALWLC
jgi:hypothetical protein